MIRLDRGSALVEALLVGLVLMVPVVWLLSALADLHRGALTVSAAARDAGFDAARAGSNNAADAAVRRAVARASMAHGVDPGAVRASWNGRPGDRGAAVRVHVTYRVRVFSLPLIGSLPRPTFTVGATHVARVDPFGSR